MNTLTSQNAEVTEKILYYPPKNEDTEEKNLAVSFLIEENKKLSEQIEELKRIKEKLLRKGNRLNFEIQIKEKALNQRDDLIEDLMKRLDRIENPKLKKREEPFACVWPIKTEIFNFNLIEQLKDRTGKPTIVYISAFAYAPIRAIEDGIVHVIGDKEIHIDHGTYRSDHLESLYRNLNEITVDDGSLVKKGTVIGLEGISLDNNRFFLDFRIIKNGKLINPLTVFDKSVIRLLRYRN